MSEEISSRWHPHAPRFRIRTVMLAILICALAFALVTQMLLIASLRAQLERERAHAAIARAQAAATQAMAAAMTGKINALEARAAGSHDRSAPPE